VKLTSWNVNGLRAVDKRGDLAWALADDSGIDVVGLQETKLHDDQLTPAMKQPPGWRGFWSFGEKKGYSGTAILVREGLDAKPLVIDGVDGARIGGAEHPEFDVEGRVVAVEIAGCALLNVYFPNGGRPDRLAFKHAWHEAFLAHITRLKQRMPVIVCGDFNVAHRPIDLAMPERWAFVSGFLPTERAWFDRLLQAGFIDTFRAEKGDLPRQFTFWETRVDARKDNLGWRIDYFVISDQLEEKQLDAWISPQVMGSDHCPVGVELDLGVAVPVAVSVGEEDDLVASADDEELVEEDDEDEDAPRWRR
jgi:exodeoxyribonuclease-3